MSPSDQLSQLAIIKVTGEQAADFLQGQLTADVVNQTADTWQFAGHCDAKGKLWAIHRVVKTSSGFLLLTAQSCAADSLAQLKKFAVFSQVDITDVSAQFTVSFTSLSAQSTSPNQVSSNADDVVTLHLENAELSLAPAAQTQVETNDAAWLRYELEHGVAQLTPATIGEFVPQMVGLDRLGGVNFKKGCYIGQETVARMHYLGQNKRLPRLMSGLASAIPAPGDTLERQMGDNWRRAGAVLNAVRYDNGEVAVLAVLPADIEDNVTIRIKGDEQSQLTLHPKFDNQEISNE